MNAGTNPILMLLFNFIILFNFKNMVIIVYTSVYIEVCRRFRQQAETYLLLATFEIPQMPHNISFRIDSDKNIQKITIISILNIIEIINDCFNSDCIPSIITD